MERAIILIAIGFGISRAYQQAREWHAALTTVLRVMNDHLDHHAATEHGHGDGATIYADDEQEVPDGADALHD